MRRGSRSVWIVFFVLATLALFYFVVQNEDKKYQWNESYRARSEQPYGTRFVQQMLETYRAEGNFILNDRNPVEKLLGDQEDPLDPLYTDYVFIGQDMYLPEGSTRALARFVEAGGNVFIAALTPPESLLKAVYVAECGADIRFERNRADSAMMNFFHDDLRRSQAFRYSYRVGTMDLPYDWSYFSDSLFCQETRLITPLAYQEGKHVNFISLRIGKGKLYLHSNPLVFTNYFLADADKLDYVSGVFAHLDGRKLIWDEYAKIPFQGNDNAYNSPLYYILSQPSLKYAWWMLLIAVALYIVFAARRKQRVLAVLEPKSNTSLEFVNLISRLHYKNGDHLDMARKKMRYFLYFVRSRYGIQAERFGDEQIRRLSGKSKVDMADVAVIFSQYYLIEDRFQSDIEVNRLVSLYEAIENFYKHCK